MPVVMLATLLNCGAPDPPMTHSLRRWPMEVPGFTPVSDVEQSEVIGCGYVAWCCFEIRAQDGYQHNFYDMFVCPAQLGQPRNRAGAWAHWRTVVHGWLHDCKDKHGGEHSSCWVRAASCHDEPQGRGVCFNYPN